MTIGGLAAAQKARVAVMLCAGVSGSPTATWNWLTAGGTCGASTEQRFQRDGPSRRLLRRLFVVQIKHSGSFCNRGSVASPKHCSVGSRAKREKE